ncbi:MAG TPA: acyl-CoA dehydrogenase family protein [bacterium]|nr:acyl-CoA dehydrogenase family protein [bacterium]
MDLTYSEEQQLIGQQAREFFERECPLERVRKAWSDRAGLEPAVWKRMAELGWLGALIPERFGGQGLGHTDLSRIVEEMGRGLLPGGYLGTLAAARALTLAAPEALQREVLPSVARGERRLALARSGEGGRFDRLGGRFYADEQDDGYLLFGEKLAVLGLAEADQVVVAAVLGLPKRIAEGLQLFLLDADAPGVEITPLATLESGWQQASLRLTGARVPRDRHLDAAAGNSPDVQSPALAPVEALLDLALAFDALGGAQRVMEMTVEYAGLRTAFGHPIGTYQAVKHKCADMLFAVENLRAAATWAAWVLDVPPEQSGADPALALAMTRATAIESYDLVIRHGTQVHGAIAVTEEHDLQLFAKRAKTLALSFGSLAHYQERILAANGFAPDGR